MSTYNPFIDNSSTINTPVISHSVDRCVASSRRRRRSVTAVGLTQGSSTLLDINIPPTTLGLYVNQTPVPDNDGIALSRFNVTSPGSVLTSPGSVMTSPGSVPVVIRLTPNDTSTRLRAFIRLDKTPSTTEYDWMLTSWDGGDNYTLYIAADLTTDATHIYIGVQLADGQSLMIAY